MWSKDIDQALFGMTGTKEDYDSRRVDSLEEDGLFISTARVMDGTHPYETFINSKDYEDSIVVQSYDSEKSAKKGHDKWVKKMKSKNPPTKLVDCCNSWIGKLAGPTVAKRKN